MVKCAYCSIELKKGTGIMYVYKSGDISYYCSSGHLRNHVEMNRRINRKLVKKEVKPVRQAEKK